MEPVETSAIIFFCIFGGALLGMWLANVLPEHHLNDETKDLIKLGVGLIGTMAALLPRSLGGPRPRVFTMHAVASSRRWQPMLSCSTARSLTTDRQPLRFGNS